MVGSRRIYVADDNLDSIVISIGAPTWLTHICSDTASFPNVGSGRGMQGTLTTLCDTNWQTPQGGETMQHTTNDRKGNSDNHVLMVMADYLGC